ncbi:hypothetical protein T492DRAFT_982896 [Pavlovales sp. CCMP2436]|nr:hypothetical protein T492DRAFT_982896 [Pavlovales sp. CCMP2436]
MPTPMELLVTLALGVLLFLALLVLGRASRRARARRHERVCVFTFANHKGGVGKTTSALFVARRLAAEDPARKVLVIDCSIYGDLTRLLLGTASTFASNNDGAEGWLVAGGNTIEHYAAALLRTRSGPFAFLRHRAPDVRAHLYSLKDSQPSAPANLYLMSSCAQWSHRSNSRGASALPTLDGVDANAVAVVAQVLRASLASGEEDCSWIVLVDTDGGVLHELTKLALCVADSVIVPANADTADARRLHVMLRYMAELHAKGNSTGTIDLCFFTALKVKANEPTEKSEALGLGFAVLDDVWSEMGKLASQFDELRAEFPQLLARLEPVDAKRTKGRGHFFAGIRHGGVTLQRMKDRPYSTELSDAVRGDFDELCKRIDQLASAKELTY